MRCRCSRRCARASGARTRWSGWPPTRSSSCCTMAPPGPRRVRREPMRRSTCRWTCCSASRRRCIAPWPASGVDDTVKAAGLELCPALGISVPVGKDSLSMRTRWSENGQALQVTAPVSLIVSAVATLDDVRPTLTPQLQPGDTTLILVDLGAGRRRMAGSMLAQVLGRFGGREADGIPDLDDPASLKALVAAIGELRRDGKLLAYHDRSDGGLWAAVCEMAFAGHLGVSLN